MTACKAQVVYHTVLLVNGHELTRSEPCKLAHETLIFNEIKIISLATYR